MSSVWPPNIGPNFPGFPMYGLLPGQGYPIGTVSGSQPTAPGTPASQVPFNIPGLEGAQQGIAQIGQNITGLQQELTNALTPAADPWHDWNTAWQDFQERAKKLFNPQAAAQPNTATSGIGSLALPELAIATIIGAIGVGLLEQYNSGYAFGLTILLLGGLFLVGGGGSQIAGSLDQLRSALHYPSIIPSGSTNNGR